MNDDLPTPNMADAMGGVPGVSDMKLDLTKEEKTRTLALMLALKYHSDTICRDADMMRELRSQGVTLTPSQAHKVVAQACVFEMFLRGDMDGAAEQALEEELKLEQEGNNDPGSKSVTAE